MVSVGAVLVGAEEVGSSMAIVVDKSGNTPNGNFAGAATDRPYCTFNRSGAGTPQASVTSLYAGERYQDTTSGIVYQAMSYNTNSSWQVATIAKETGA